MAGISRLQMLNLETKINSLFRKSGFSFIGWIRGSDSPQDHDSPADFKGIPFKPITGGSLPKTIKDCKDVSDLMELKAKQGIGFYLFPMFPDHFDNLEEIALEGEYMADKQISRSEDIDENDFLEWKKERELE